MLRYLARQAAPVHAAAMSRDLCLPRSSTYHLLSTLVEEGFVAYLPEERRYCLGVSAFELASGYTRQGPLQRLARMPLAALVDHTGHSAHLAVLHGRDVIYVLEERAPGRPPLVTDVGVRLPAQLTASGRAILAALPFGAVRALFPSPADFVLRNASGPRSLPALAQLLVGVRRLGYAAEAGEVTAGFSTVAAVVASASAHPEAAVAVTYPDDAVSDDERRAIPRAVVRTADEISHRMGATPSCVPRDRKKQ